MQATATAEAYAGAFASAFKFTICMPTRRIPSWNTCMLGMLSSYMRTAPLAICSQQEGDSSDTGGAINCRYPKIFSCHRCPGCDFELPLLSCRCAGRDFKLRRVCRVQGRGTGDYWWRQWWWGRRRWGRRRFFEGSRGGTVAMAPAIAQSSLHGAAVA